MKSELKRKNIQQGKPLFNDNQEGKTRFADDDTLLSISRLEKKVAIYEEELMLLRDDTDTRQDGWISDRCSKALKAASEVDK